MPHGKDHHQNNHKLTITTKDKTNKRITYHAWLQRLDEIMKKTMMRAWLLLLRDKATKLWEQTNCQKLGVGTRAKNVVLGGAARGSVRLIKPPYIGLSENLANNAWCYRLTMLASTVRRWGGSVWCGVVVYSEGGECACRKVSERVRY